MNGDLKWEYAHGKLRPFVYYRFDADDCEGVAAAMTSSDEWGRELLEDAEALRRLELDDDAGRAS